MSRPLNARKPTASELHRVHRWLERSLQPWQRRRAEVLLLHAAGVPASAMAGLLQVHANTVYADLRDFARHGLSSLSRPRTVGASPSLSAEQIATIRRWPASRPRPWACRSAAGAWPRCATTSCDGGSSGRSAASTSAGC